MIHQFFHKVQLRIRPWASQFTNKQTVATQQAATTVIIPTGKWVAIGEARSDTNQRQQGFLKHSRSSQMDQLRIYIRVQPSY